MDLDLGAPASYLTLDEGADVYASDGEKIGHVEEIRAAMDKDIFEGLVVRHGLVGSRRLVVADQVDEIYEKGVLLAIDSNQAEHLPEPD